MVNRMCPPAAGGRFGAVDSERRIMHQSAVVAVFDPAEIAEREAELRRDLERFASERDAKIKRIREQ